MSISSISSAVTANDITPSAPNQASPRALWAQIGSSLNSSNLAGAQKAFASLKSLYEQNHPGTVPSGPLASDVASLGTALKSGSLVAAQSAFSTLKQAAESAGIIGNSSSGTGAVPSTNSRVNLIA